MSTAETAAPVHNEADILMARRWAALYRERGYNPLPTRPDAKRPFIRYSEYWETPFPAAEFNRFETGSVQVMTGRRWGLAVIDLDGPEAIAYWEANSPGVGRPWVSHSGGDGRHLWFSIPTNGPPIPSGRLWGIWEPEANGGKGAWKKHVAVEIVADRKLIMAPPSIHPTTGKRYRWIAGRSPKDSPNPARMPAWILDLPRIKPPSEAPAIVPMNEVLRRTVEADAYGRYDWRDVLDAIGDKVGLAASMGLRFATRTPNPSGWCSCHSIHREDRSPSASFHPESGVYWEAGTGTLRFFDLLAKLGAYDDWRAAVADLGSRYGAAEAG